MRDYRWAFFSFSSPLSFTLNSSLHFLYIKTNKFNSCLSHFFFFSTNLYHYNPRNKKTVGFSLRLLSLSSFSSMHMVGVFFVKHKFLQVSKQTDKVECGSGRYWSFSNLRIPAKTLYEDSTTLDVVYHTCEQAG